MLDLSGEQIKKALNNGIDFYMDNNKNVEVIKWEEEFQKTDEHFDNLKKHIKALDISKSN